MLPNNIFSPRGGSGVWAQREDNIEAFRRGDQFGVNPVAAEYAPILACDADCPLCPYRKSRMQSCGGLISEGTFAAEDNISASNEETARIICERIREARIPGVLITGGGEPLKWSLLVPTLQYSHSLGMVNGLYTNGFQLVQDEGLAYALMSPASGMVFVRMSINTVSPRAAILHWGLSTEVALQQELAMRSLISARDRLAPEYREVGKPVPSIQISTIVDKNNVDDLKGVCDLVARVMAERTVNGPEDVMVVRPLTVHGRKRYSVDDHHDSVIRKIIDQCGATGPCRQQLQARRVRLFLGFDLGSVDSGSVASYSDLIHAEYRRRGISLAGGLFLTIGPDGSVFPSTEYNCRKGWEMGDLTRQSVAEIWASNRRREMLEYFNRHKWGPSVSQPTARTNRLDRIAQAVRDGELGDADIAQIRKASYLSPPLMLD